MTGPLFTLRPVHSQLLSKKRVIRKKAPFELNPRFTPQAHQPDAKQTYLIATSGLSRIKEAKEEATSGKSPDPAKDRSGLGRSLSSKYDQVWLDGS